MDFKTKMQQLLKKKSDAKSAVIRPDTGVEEAGDDMGGASFSDRVRNLKKYGPGKLDALMGFPTMRAPGMFLPNPYDAPDPFSHKMAECADLLDAVRVEEMEVAGEQIRTLVRSDSLAVSACKQKMELSRGAMTYFSDCKLDSIESCWNGALSDYERAFGWSNIIDPSEQVTIEHNYLVCSGIHSSGVKKKCSDLAAVEVEYDFGSKSAAYPIIRREGVYRRYRPDLIVEANAVMVSEVPSMEKVLKAFGVARTAVRDPLLVEMVFNIQSGLAACRYHCTKLTRLVRGLMMIVGASLAGVNVTGKTKFDVVDSVTTMPAGMREPNNTYVWVGDEGQPRSYAPFLAACSLSYPQEGTSDKTSILSGYEVFGDGTDVCCVTGFSGPAAWLRGRKEFDLTPEAAWQHLVGYALDMGCEGELETAQTVVGMLLFPGYFPSVSLPSTTHWDDLCRPALSCRGKEKVYRRSLNIPKMLKVGLVAATQTAYMIKEVRSAIADANAVCSVESTLSALAGNPERRQMLYGRIAVDNGMRGLGVLRIIDPLSRPDTRAVSWCDDIPFGALAWATDIKGYTAGTLGWQMSRVNLTLSKRSTRDNARAQAWMGNFQVLDCASYTGIPGPVVGSGEDILELADTFVEGDASYTHVASKVVSKIAEKMDRSYVQGKMEPEFTQAPMEYYFVGKSRASSPDARPRAGEDKTVKSGQDASSKDVTPKKAKVAGGVITRSASAAISATPTAPTPAAKRKATELLVMEDPIVVDITASDVTTKGGVDKAPPTSAGNSAAKTVPIEERIVGSPTRDWTDEDWLCTIGRLDKYVVSKANLTKRLLGSRKFERSMSIKIGRSVLHILENADICEVMGGWVVNCANSKMAHAGGIAKIICEHSGDAGVFSKAGPTVAEGQCGVQKEGLGDWSRLNGVSGILHAVGPDFRQGGSSKYCKMMDSMAEKIATAVLPLQSATIHTPLVSCGVFRGERSLPLVIASYLSGWARVMESESDRSLDVVVYARGAAEYDAAEKGLKEWLGVK